MAVNFLSRLTAKGDNNTLTADLKRVTDSRILNIPEELLRIVRQGMHTEDDRRTVLQHVQGCLCEPSGRRWQRTYAGLVLVEDLVKNGPPVLLAELADGFHFDLVQRVTFLEHFQYSDDKRAQSVVCNKAKALRPLVVERLQAASGDTVAPAAGGGSDAKSGDSPRAASITSYSTTASSLSSEDGPPPEAPRPEGQMILNGIVAVGHCDDTTSESSDGEGGGVRRAVTYRKSRKGARRGLKGSPTDTDRSSEQGRNAEPASSTIANLDRAAATSAPSTCAPCVDLLDL